MPNTYYELNVMFRDSGNYKDTGIVIVDAETYSNIKGAINSGGEITIEDIGLTVDDFFNKVIKRPYDEDSDHNFIEINPEDVTPFEVPFTTVECCKDCGSHHVARLKWVNVNTEELYSDAYAGIETEWCMNCKEETTIVEPFNIVCHA
ncbi:MAG TPA: hypothetical protein PLP63_06695 [Saprospiraceae bacterium]|nr:hypothetical protein [Saprospiraceae bacterium]